MADLSCTIVSRNRHSPPKWLEALRSRSAAGDTADDSWARFEGLELNGLTASRQREPPGQPRVR